MGIFFSIIIIFYDKCISLKYLKKLYSLNQIIENFARFYSYADKNKINYYIK